MYSVADLWEPFCTELSSSSSVGGVDLSATLTPRLRICSSKRAALCFSLLTFGEKSERLRLSPTRASKPISSKRSASLVMYVPKSSDCCSLSTSGGLGGQSITDVGSWTFLEIGGRGGPGGFALGRFRTGSQVPSAPRGAVAPPCNRILLGLSRSEQSLVPSRGFGGLRGSLAMTSLRPPFQAKAA
jgi:hypothetical protein